jgi:hypothetical protein
MSIILKVAGYKSDKDKAADQESLKRVLGIIAKTAPVFKDMKDWLSGLNRVIQESLKDDRSDLSDDEIWQTKVSEWFTKFSPIEKQFKSLADDLEQENLPSAPTIKGKTPDHNLNEAAHLLKQTPQLTPSYVSFHGSKISYKVSEIKAIEEQCKKWLTREKELATISKSLEAQGKHPNFK